MRALPHHAGYRLHPLGTVAVDFTEAACLMMFLLAIAVLCIGAHP